LQRRRQLLLVHRRPRWSVAGRASGFILASLYPSTGERKRMTTFQAIILGLIQGLTEFLPISSTAHLRIVPALLGWEDISDAAFTAVIQLGTLAAVLWYFRHD